jgi:hypothetical protein
MNMCSMVHRHDKSRLHAQAKLDGIDKVLLKGLKHMNWKSHAIGEFISTTVATVKDTNTILQTCKVIF